MTFMSVDLPEPDGPMIATYSLRPMARSTPRKRAHDFAAHVVLALDAARHDDPLRVGRRAGRATNDLPLGGFAERCFYGVVAHDLVPGVGFFASTLVSRTSAPSFSSRIAW